MKHIYMSFLLYLSFQSAGQISLSYYPFRSSQVAVSSNTEKFLWGDLRIETNTFFSNLNVELAAAVNLKRTEAANYYVAPGISINPVVAAAGLPLINGYFINTGARIKPFRANRNIHLIFELSPYLNYYLSGGNLRGRLGLGYNFKRKTKE